MGGMGRWKIPDQQGQTNPAIRVRGSPKWGVNGMGGEWVFKEKNERNQIWTFFDMSSRLDMAEFKAIVTASFDDIGSNVALDYTRPLHPNRLAPPDSKDKTARRPSPLSFLRKVKSHATSLLVSQPRPVSASPSPSRSFVPSLLPSRQPNPAPFASSLPRRHLLTRALGKHSHIPHVPDLEPISSFFDDDDDEDEVDSRRISTARAHPRLSAFAAPILFGLSLPSVSTPYLVSEKNDVVRPESGADLVHVCARFLLDPLP